MKSKKTSKRIIFITALVIFVASAVYLAVFFYNPYKTGQEYNNNNLPNSTTGKYGTLSNNPVDFDTLIKGNDDIYAWITIDDTKVDYPIVQNSTGDDEFYLTHSAIDKSYLKSGAIYTEACNKKDFSDPVTLIYGHNNFGDSMFTTLHKFEKKNFFDNHEFVYIYMPKKKLTYKIISAFKYDNRHIMNTNDFSDKENLSEFQQMILNPAGNNKNVRENIEKLDENSKIIVLSTCITGDKESRYLVCCLLVNEEETN